MSAYSFKTNDPAVVKTVRTYLEQIKEIQKAADAFCEKYSVGKPGFDRCWISKGDYSFRAVHMTHEQWDQNYRVDWYRPDGDWATPRRPRKRKEPSQLYLDYCEVRDMEAKGKPVAEAIGDNSAFNLPGIFIHNDTVYVQHSEVLTAPEMVEITGSEFDQADQAWKGGKQC